MALEPITRQEQIVAGKDLEPITRMEMFLKQYGGGSGGGASSWNDLKDKPFGEETVVVNEPLNITWDGNTEGLVSVADMFYKVSDAVIVNNEDVKNLMYKHSQNPTESTLADMWDELMSNGFVTDDVVFCAFINVIRKAGTTINYMGKEFVFPEKGIYLMLRQNAYIEYVYSTEPVEQIKTVVKPLAEQYMPTLTSPSGKKFKLSVDDSGVLSATEVTE